MIIVLDASTLINLANGEVLSSILRLPGVTFQVSAVVRGESKTIAKAIDAAVLAGRLTLVDDSLITVSAFAAAKTRMNLDDGETECILAAEALGHAVACDDRAARRWIAELLGEARLSGSIGLMRLAVIARLLDQKSAFEAYRLMRVRGGFLPELTQGDF